MSNRNENQNGKRKRQWTPRPADPAFMSAFERVLDSDTGPLHLAVLLWVVEHMPQLAGDPQALHAAVFTLKTETLAIVRDPNLSFYKVSENPRENLERFREYIDAVGRPGPNAFVDLVVGLSETGDTPHSFAIDDGAEVMQAMRDLAWLTPDLFPTVIDYVALAEGVVLYWCADPEDGELLDEADELFARAVGQNRWRDLQKII